MCELQQDSKIETAVRNSKLENRNSRKCRIDAGADDFRFSTFQFRISNGGFTLIELIVVILILGLLAGLVVPRLFKHATQAKINVTKAQIAAFQTALGAYKLDTGTFPSTDQGLQALRTTPPGVNNWNGPYLPKDIPLDAWGRAYLYKYPGDHGDEPDIISYGADGQPGGEGENADILSWK